MRTFMMLMMLSGSAAATSAEPVSPYAPLEFLAGHCWKGALPGGRGEDTHCFTHIYDSHFVRDKHTVHAAAHADYLGESIYYWDSVARQLKYLYVESDGGSSAGVVSSGADALVFPPSEYQQDGKTQVYRSRWRKNGEDAYDVITEFKNGEEWKPGWSVHMEKVAQK